MIEYATLDKINFLPLLKTGTKIKDIITWVEQNFYFMHMKGHIEEEEFVVYLKKRYPDLQLTPVQVCYIYYEVAENYEGGQKHGV